MGNCKKGEHSFLGLLSIWSVCIFKKKKKKELMENKILLCSSAAALQHNVSQAGYKSVF